MEFAFEKGAPTEVVGNVAALVILLSTGNVTMQRFAASELDVYLQTSTC